MVGYVLMRLDERFTGGVNNPEQAGGEADAIETPLSSLCSVLPMRKRRTSRSKSRC